MANEAWIVSAARTPIGSFSGAFATVSAPQLGAVAVKAALNRGNYPAAELDEVIMGNVLSAGVGQNPARQASLDAEVPDSVGATTVSKVCGSGLKAIMLASQAIRLGDARAIVAGGMESMTLAPYLLPKARAGYRMGNGEIVDSMINDGLWDCYGNQHMGNFGDQCAREYGFTKEEQDDFAVRSYTRAREAIAAGAFAEEIEPVEVRNRKGAVTVSEDEEPQRFDETKLRALRPAFAHDGTISAGNASTINDGAAAVLVTDAAVVGQLEAEPLARIVGAATFSDAPPRFTTAPIGAIRKLMQHIDWSPESTDLFEINEAFAAVAMAAERDLLIPADKLNVRGGAVAIGHPIGCSGARILVTLLHALKSTGGKRGIASLCIGGGEAVAVAVETT